MSHALHFLVLALAGWVTRHQENLIDYLREENRVLREHLGPRPLRLTDAQRRRLAVRGQKLGRRILSQVAGIVTPDTILRWYRRLIAQQYDGIVNLLRVARSCLVTSTPPIVLSRRRRWCTNTVRRFEAADQTERMKSRVHPKYKTKYRVKNWASYDRVLVRRGDITIWLSPAAIAAWEPDRAGTRGAQRKYSDLAIESALTRRLLFHLPLRQAEGFLRSLFVLMGLDLRVPDHTTLSRRGRHLDLSLRRGPSPHHRQQWSVDRRRG